MERRGHKLRDAGATRCQESQGRTLPQSPRKDHDSASTLISVQ